MSTDAVYETSDVAADDIAGDTASIAQVETIAEMRRMTARLVDLLVADRDQSHGMARTPERMAAALQSLTQGYREDLRTIVNGALFEVAHDGIVEVRDIELFSLCEHHVLPFFGKAHVRYVPRGRVLGLSKIPRIVDMFARRLQLQERLTTQIADALEEVLQPRGVSVVIEARHCCLMMRGARKYGARMVTRTARGVLRAGAGELDSE